MDDMLKAFGAAAGLGVAFAFAVMAWRVYHDPELTLLVVGGGVVTAVALATGLAFVLYRHAVEARRLSIADNLTHARVLRTLGTSFDAPRLPAPAGGDLLASLISGLPTQDVVDVPVRHVDADREGDDQ